VAFVIPNLNHAMHNGKPGQSIPAADAWLRVNPEAMHGLPKSGDAAAQCCRRRRLRQDNRHRCFRATPLARWQADHHYLTAAPSSDVNMTHGLFLDATLDATAGPDSRPLLARTPDELPDHFPQLFIPADPLLTGGQEQGAGGYLRPFGFDLHMGERSRAQLCHWPRSKPRARSACVSPTLSPDATRRVRGRRRVASTAAAPPHPRAPASSPRSRQSRPRSGTRPAAPRSSAARSSPATRRLVGSIASYCRRGCAASKGACCSSASNCLLRRAPRVIRWQTHQIAADLPVLIGKIP
jgi:hypothetical protein